MSVKNINLIFDPSKKMGRVDFMNSMAEVLRILHTDPKVKCVVISTFKNGKQDHSFTVKLS